jgi:hypothetical protein
LSIGRPARRKQPLGSWNCRDIASGQIKYADRRCRVVRTTGEKDPVPVRRPIRASLRVRIIGHQCLRGATFRRNFINLGRFGCSRVPLADVLSIGRPARRKQPLGLLLFDFDKQNWTEVAEGQTVNWMGFSRTGRYLEFFDGTDDGAVLNYGLKERKTQRIVDLKKFITTGYYGSWLGMAPDDSPLILRDAATQDVYSLDWEERSPSQTRSAMSQRDREETEVCSDRPRHRTVCA